ncbi:MAG: hypothetical protein DMF74_17385 [Acidobacteria bacterium]|nr:MAG: hypothetical protein DMF74_17385 [Acidobacteriota bacterium]
MIAKAQFSYANDYIEMADFYVVFYVTFLSINDTEANPDSFADMVTKEQPVTRPHQKRRQ